MEIRYTESNLLVILNKEVLEMKKWGKVFVLTGSIVAMLITGTGCSKKNTGIKNPVDEDGNMTGSK